MPCSFFLIIQEVAATKAPHSTKPNMKRNELSSGLLESMFIEMSSTQSWLADHTRVAGITIISGFVRNPNVMVRVLSAEEAGSKHGIYASRSSTCIEMIWQCLNICPSRIKMKRGDLPMARSTNSVQIGQNW